MISSLPDLVFYFFSFGAIFSALIATFSKNSVYSVLSLILCMLLSSGTILMLGAEYIAVTLIIVYVGAVAILFLFVVMMLDIKIHDVVRKIPKSWYISILSSISFLFMVYSAFSNSKDLLGLNIENNIKASNIEEIGKVLYTSYVIEFQLSGIILLVAMVIAISLTYYKSKKIKKQSSISQLRRNRENSIILKKVKPVS